MAEPDKEDYPYLEGAAYHLLYKEWVTQEELDAAPKYPIAEGAIVERNKLYRWDETRAVICTDDYQYKFFILKEVYDGKAKALYDDWVACRGQEYVDREVYQDQRQHESSDRVK